MVDVRITGCSLDVLVCIYLFDCTEITKLYFCIASDECSKLRASSLQPHD